MIAEAMVLTQKLKKISLGELHFFIHSGVLGGVVIFFLTRFWGLNSDHDLCDSMCQG